MTRKGFFLMGVGIALVPAIAILAAEPAAPAGSPEQRCAALDDLVTEMREAGHGDQLFAGSRPRT